MPEITGETASGRSMSVIRKLLPRNSNFAMAHAAASPKIVLTGTTTAAVDQREADGRAACPDP